MKRILIVLWLMSAMMFVQNIDVYSAENECEEINFAVVDTPVNMTVNVKQCVKIVTPPETIVYIGDNYESLTVKFDDRKITSKGMLFRVGTNVGRYELQCAGNCSDYLKAAIEITDVPEHLKGGKSALFYRYMEQAGGKWHKLSFLRDYPLQVMVPRGYDIKLKADAKAAVKYGDTKIEIEPEKEIFIEGKPGYDLVEIRSFNMDGEVTISSFPKEQQKKQPTKLGNKKMKSKT